MRDLFKKMAETLESEDIVLVTIVASSGSTPRGAGARMVVTKEGRICGTIGGGSVEYQSELAAKEVLKKKNARMEHYQLRRNEIQDLGMICGGDVEVYFHYIGQNDKDMLLLAEKIEASYQKKQRLWLICEITPDMSGGIGIYSEEDGAIGLDVPQAVLDKAGVTPKQVSAEGRQFYCELLPMPEIVHIFGGGHVSQALVPVLSYLGFACRVYEDREAFAQKELFPSAENVSLIDNSRIQDFASIGPDDYAVIMTRGHKDDQLVQGQVLKTHARYIGVIGSRRKRQGVFNNLKNMGFTDADLARIKTPIGLDIQAETPEEIAVSIAGEMIAVRRS